MSTQLGSRALLATFCLLLTVAGGCSRNSERARTEAFFVDWLKSHGEMKVVVDSPGVGIAGNATRLKAKPYETKRDGDGRFTAEMEFRILLPSDDEIVEFVIGMGKTRDEAIKDSMLNFMLTTFHVVYRSFMNANDPHQKVHDVTVNGTKRQMMMGDIYVRGGDDVKAPMDFEPFRIQIRDEICKLPFSAQPHWIKIVAAQVPGKPTIVSSTVDNRAHDELDAALKALKWPGPNRGYMMKEFIVLK